MVDRVEPAEELGIIEQAILGTDANGNVEVAFTGVCARHIFDDFVALNRPASADGTEKQG